VASITALTPTATADGSIYTSNGVFFLESIANDYCRVSQLSIHGDNTSGGGGVDNQWALRRSTTVATATITNRTPALANPLSIYTASFKSAITTGGTMGTCAALATIQHVWSPSVNAQSGIYLWSPLPNEEIVFFSATANNAELGLTTVSGTGVSSLSFMVEEM